MSNSYNSTATINVFVTCNPSKSFFFRFLCRTSSHSSTQHPTFYGLDSFSFLSAHTFSSLYVSSESSAIYIEAYVSPSHATLKTPETFHHSLLLQRLSPPPSEPVTLSVLPQPSPVADQEPYSGCGSQAYSVSPPNIPKPFYLSSTASEMRTVPFRRSYVRYPTWTSF
jgi:hypothetical protein